MKKEEKELELESDLAEIAKDEEIESTSLACCRICLESESELGDELISPCMCKGTQQFVHRSCLDHWRSVKEGFAFSHCTTCKAQFHLRLGFLEDCSWRQFKFHIFVARDVLLVFLFVQAVIATIGSVAFLLDRNGNFFEGWDHFRSKYPVPFYYCVGLLVSLMLLGFVGLILHRSALHNNHRPGLPGNRPIMFVILGIVYGFLAATMAVKRIWRRHYHILAKRELTKEYVVEDLRGKYRRPKLDPVHKKRLKMLHLL